MSKLQINEATAIQEGLHIFNNDPSDYYTISNKRGNIIKEHLRVTLNLKENITDEQFQDLIPDAFELKKIDDEITYYNNDEYYPYI